MLRVGIIGLGRMGMLHLMNCQHMANVEVVAAADQSKKALKKAGSVGVKSLYNSFQEILQHSPAPDAVIISLPNFLHYESIKLALEKGLNIFVEKPLANTVNECRDISNMVKKSGRKLMVGHCFRFMKIVETLKEGLEKGYIGKLEVATIEEVINGPFSHPRLPAPVSDWWFDPQKSGGGVLIDLGYHMIDLFRFFSEEDCEVVFSYMSHKLNLPVEDGAITILKSKNYPMEGIINVGWYQKLIFPKYNFRVILHGNAGYLSSDELKPRNLFLHAVKEGSKNFLRKIAGKKIHPLSYTYYYDSYYKELKHFFNCIVNDSTPEVTVNDGLKTIELIQKAYEKASKNPM